MPRPVPLVPTIIADRVPPDRAELLRIEIVVTQETDMAVHGELLRDDPINLVIGCEAIEGERGTRKVIVSRLQGTGAWQKAPRGLLQKRQKLLGHRAEAARGDHVVASRRGA